MNIQILDSWLREFLKTKASAKLIAKTVSLSGPTFDRTNAVKVNNKKDWIYDVEVTTNRVDAMSVYGIAREAVAVLSQSDIKARLAPLNLKKDKSPAKSLPFTIVNNQKLARRAMGIVIENIEKRNTPDWMRVRLETSGIRSLNAIVDITNYVMLEIGHPTHAFDYDKIKNKKFIIRESQKGEKITSFDGKNYELPGGDIIFDDGEGEIIDLPGIIGAKNSVVDENTRKVLFFVDNSSPRIIRKTSMTLNIRTLAAALNEKNVDPELAEIALLRGINLFQTVCKGRIASKIYDNYPNPYKTKTISVSKKFINSRLGIDIPNTQIKKILVSLGFTADLQKDEFKIQIPSFRASDINIPEDIVEEVARIYGYHNLPSELMATSLPQPVFNTTFDFEAKLKNLLVGHGGREVYTLSMVPAKWVDTKKALELKNPLGKNSRYLKTSLMPSLIEAAQKNRGGKEPFHIFEMANVYIPKTGQLPKEKLTVAGVFFNYPYREAKGIIEAILKKLNIKYFFGAEDMAGFIPSKRVKIISEGELLGELGVTESDFIYWELEVEKLRKLTKALARYQPIPKYPAQIEDLTLILPPKTQVGELMGLIEKQKYVSKVDLRDIHKDAYTFRIWYQHPSKTFTNKEVEKLRNKIVGELSKKFGAVLKD